MLKVWMIWILFLISISESYQIKKFIHGTNYIRLENNYTCFDSSTYSGIIQLKVDSIYNDSVLGIDEDMIDSLQVNNKNNYNIILKSKDEINNLYVKLESERYKKYWGYLLGILSGFLIFEVIQ